MCVCVALVQRKLFSYTLQTSIYLYCMISQLPMQTKTNMINSHKHRCIYKIRLIMIQSNDNRVHHEKRKQVVQNTDYSVAQNSHVPGYG